MASNKQFTFWYKDDQTTALPFKITQGEWVKLRYGTGRHKNEYDLQFKSVSSGVAKFETKGASWLYFYAQPDGKIYLEPFGDSLAEKVTNTNRENLI
jgi:hypothetical protein